MVLLVAFVALGLVPYAASAAQFSIVNVEWGTPSAALFPMPGQYGTPLTVVMQNWQCGQIKNVTLTLSTWSTNFTTVNRQGSIAESISNVSSNQQFQFTFYLNIPSNIAPGVYDLPAQITWESTTNTYDNCTSTPSAFYSLHTPYYFSVPVYISGNPVLQYSANTTSLVAGKVNNLTLYISDNGFGNAMQVQFSVSPLSQSVGVLNHLGIISSLGAGSKAALNLSVYIPSNFTSSLLSFNVSAQFLNGSSGFQHQKNILSFLVSPSSQLGVAENVSTVYVGYTSPLVIGITNKGSAPISSVEASLGMSKMNTSSSGEVSVTGGNPSYYSVVEPGQTIWFMPYITTGPSTPEGGYGSTLSVSYSNSNGAQETDSYPIGFAVASRVSIITDGVSVSSSGINSSSITVSGSLIDQGSGNAYYATVYAYMTRNGTIVSSNSSYVGEVLTDSPTPFSFTVSMPAMQGYLTQSTNAASGNFVHATRNTLSGNTITAGISHNEKVELYVTYQNDLGGQFKTNESFYSIGGSSPHGIVPSGSAAVYYRNTASSGIPIYIYAIAVAAAACAGFLAYRRMHGPRKKKPKERQVL